MSHGTYAVPLPLNEPVKNYAPGSPERASLQGAIRDIYATHTEVCMHIHGESVGSGVTQSIRPPHACKEVVGHYHKGEKKHVDMAIKSCLSASQEWADMPWQARSAIFLKAAELLAGPYRDKINAATMVGQSKNPYQAEIDSACELIDFFRFNVAFAEKLYAEQPYSSPGIWNRTELRPLEGFVTAITPFNFTSIAANLPAAPALMGNTVVWKPSDKQILSAQVIVDLFHEAGLPNGVINMVLVSGQDFSNVCFNHRDFAGIHFTGSTGVFNDIWKSIGSNMNKYRGYPRIVGETGGKDFILAHPSALPAAVATAISRGAFEYQGQKCSAASRAYIPSNIWPEVRDRIVAQISSFKMGRAEDFTNFINAVIDVKSYDKLKKYIDDAKKDKGVEVLIGGNCSNENGYFIQPTVLVVKDPGYVTMCDELFGPVLTLHVYNEKDYDKILTVVDNTSPYALTGAVFAQDRAAIVKTEKALKYAAGNFYINDKPTGAVVGQQPFGGARASGTNDKAGSALNLTRWVSARTIKETFVPPVDWKYPFLSPDRP